jgi:hypothetical protein
MYKKAKPTHIPKQITGKGISIIGICIVGFQSHQLPITSSRILTLIFEIGKNNFKAHILPCVAQSNKI